MTAHAVIIGAGIGGLAAAAGLQQAGWEVTVCERAAALEPVGAGLAVAPNGLRALDVLGAADEIQSLAIAQEPGIRRRDGRWLARSSGRMVAARFGDPVVLLARTALVEALLDRISGPAIRLSTPVTGVEPGGPSRSALVTTTAGDLDADLVVAADGIRSGIRASLFPDPGPDVARRSRRIAAMATGPHRWPSPPGTPWSWPSAGSCPAPRCAALRSLAPVLDWHPPPRQPSSPSGSGRLITPYRSLWPGSVR